MASICIEEYILPILDSSYKFEELIENKYNTALYKIYETLFILDREKDLERFKDLFSANFTQDQLENLLTEFIEAKTSDTKLNTSKPIKELFNLRLKYLQEKVNDSDASVNWIMKGTIPDHPDLETFLKSNKQQFIYRGSDTPMRVFIARMSADCFVSKFSGVKSDYSVEMIVGKNPEENYHIVINKTMDYIQSARDAYKVELIKKIKLLKSYFNYQIDL